MERQHFQLEQGFLNVDEQGIYLSRSGNWQEAREAPEWSSKGTAAMVIRRTVGWSLILAGVTTEVLQLLASTSTSLLLMIGLTGLGLLSLYGTMRHDLARAFRVPFDKFIGMERDGEHTILRFLDRELKDRTRSIRTPQAAHDLMLSNWRTHTLAG